MKSASRIFAGDPAFFDKKHTKNENTIAFLCQMLYDKVIEHEDAVQTCTGICVSAGIRRTSMDLDVQRASLWKRIAAWMFDSILVAVLAVGIGAVLSAAFGYDGYSTRLDEIYAKYELQYGVVFAVTPEEYESMTPEAIENYHAAYDALIKDEETIYVYNMVMNLSLVITTLGILLAVLGLEFIVPLLLGNGQTLGKKIFGICLMRGDCVKINTMQLFVRTILGKFTIETMIPVYIAIMIFWGAMGSTGTLILAAFLLLQVLLPLLTRNRCVIHDMLAGTAAVDFSSQKIFATAEDLIEYKKKAAAEQSARQVY